MRERDVDTQARYRQLHAYEFSPLANRVVSGGLFVRLNDRKSAIIKLFIMFMCFILDIAFLVRNDVT